MAAGAAPHITHAEVVLTDPLEARYSQLEPLVYRALSLSTRVHSHVVVNMITRATTTWGLPNTVVTTIP